MFASVENRRGCHKLCFDSIDEDKFDQCLNMTNEARGERTSAERENEKQHMEEFTTEKQYSDWLQVKLVAILKKSSMYTDVCKDKNIDVRLKVGETFYNARVVREGGFSEGFCANFKYFSSSELSKPDLAVEVFDSDSPSSNAILPIEVKFTEVAKLDKLKLKSAFQQIIVYMVTKIRPIKCEGNS
jgi:polyferredoxin